MKLPNRGPVGGRPPYGGGTGKPQHPIRVEVKCAHDDIQQVQDAGGNLHTFCVGCGETLAVLRDRRNAADAALQVISSIADDLDEWAADGKRRGYVARQARRLREHVAKVDAALGFEDERDDNVTSGPHE